MADAGIKLTAQEKIAKAHKAYDAINRGEAGGDFTEDAVWHSMNFGEVKGREAIRAAQRRQGEMFDSLYLDVHDVLVSDDHVVSMMTLRTSRGGQTAEQKLVQVAHVTDDGKVKELWTLGG